MKEGIYAQMEDIRAHSLQHNAVDGIHAILQYQSGWFIHWAEGPSPALRALLQRVAEDPRHHSPHTVHLSRGAAHPAHALVHGDVAGHRVGRAVRPPR